MRLLAMLACMCGCSAKSSPPQTKAESDKTEIQDPVVHVYRLDGFYYDKLAETSDGPFAPPANNLRRWPIIDKRRINDRTLAADWSGAVHAANNFGGSGKDCFWPGMAVTLGEGDQRIDAIICLECDRLYLYAEGADAEHKALSERGHEEFSRLFASAFPDQAKP